VSQSEARRASPGGDLDFAALDPGIDGRLWRQAFAAIIGSELRRPLGIAIVGGLLLSPFLTLNTTRDLHLSQRVCRIFPFGEGPGKKAASDDERRKALRLHAAD
jgi:hypothetical protein